MEQPSYEEYYTREFKLSQDDDVRIEVDLNIGIAEIIDKVQGDAGVMVCLEDIPELIAHLTEIVRLDGGKFIKEKV